MVPSVPSSEILFCRGFLSSTIENLPIHQTNLHEFKDSVEQYGIPVDPRGGIQVYISAYSDDFRCTQFDRHHDMQTHKQLWKIFAVYICKKYVYTSTFM